MKLKVRIINNLPLLFLILTVLILSFRNYVPGTYFIGWDNSHPEFNFKEFARRVISGAWVEFQGTGAPAAQSQLAEIPRLPLLYLLIATLPNNLVRYVFNFLMVLIGGLTMYFYLARIWLNKLNKYFSNWLACFGGLFYILNLISLQQFFINFELFAVEFAFFPLILISIHIFTKKLNPTNILMFATCQLLFTPTAYVPTVFYIAFLFFLIYTFFLTLELEKNFFKALKNTFLVGILIFFINAFWLLPNLYYTLNNSHYVKESIANRLFNMEALSSVNEAGRLENFLTGMHYIFTWKDFNFASRQYEPIFSAWFPHLSSNLVLIFVLTFNIFSIVGIIYIILEREKGIKRWGIVVMYLLNILIIWMGILLPETLIELLYKSEIILQAFRNPFTKLSNYYSFVLTITFTSIIEIMIYKIHSSKILPTSSSRLFSILLLFFFFSGVFYISLPSFQGNFISNKLKAKYPKEYFEMFSYLKTKPKNMRVLELPFLSHAGWLYYDWQHLGKGNGYQGMGFYLFGLPQPLLTPDHARWTETTDFFYHELKLALNSQNPNLLIKTLEKYNVNLIIVDETSQWKTRPDYNKIHQLLKEIGYPTVWKKNFLTIYEVPNKVKIDTLIIPEKINFVSADVNRVSKDVVYEKLGDYININPENANIIFPFANLNNREIKNISIGKNSVEITKNVPQNDYVVEIPNLERSPFLIPAEVSYSKQLLKITFPQTKIVVNEREFKLYNLDDIIVNIDKKYPLLVFFFNERNILINENQTIYPLLPLNYSTPIEINWAGLTKINDSKNISNYESIKLMRLNNHDPEKDIRIEEKKLKKIKIIQKFPFINANLGQFPSENCGDNGGEIKTSFQREQVIYIADKYGVNCNHYNFNNVDLNYPYLLNVIGQNYYGRSIKFFINYNSKNNFIVPEEYLLLKDKFFSNIVLLPIYDYPLKPYNINWETRSYGKKSKNALYQMSIIPFPVDKLSQINISKTVKTAMVNKLKLISQKSYLTFLYIVKAECGDDRCFLGIDQSYDDLWLAFDDNLNLLPHYRYNNWANLWGIHRSGSIFIFYLPQIISFLFMFMLFIFMSYLLIKTFLI